MILLATKQIEESGNYIQEAFLTTFPPVRIVVELSKALSLDNNQASAHPRAGCCLKEPSELTAVD